jgi:acyl dehydratase
MTMRIIANLAELKSLIGQTVAVTDWVAVLQPQVNEFAEATGDRQWIHVDEERCQRESPYKATIAHGFLSLSLIPMLLEQAISMPDVEMALNYGLNKVRFPTPLLVGSRVRAHIQLQQVEDIKGGAQVYWQITIECEGQVKPVCVAELITRRYP